jgi:hypothetical protein
METCQRCYKVVEEACKNETEWADCSELRRPVAPRVFDYCFIHTRTGRKFRNKVELPTVADLNAWLNRLNRVGMGAWVYYTEADNQFVPMAVFPKGESHEYIQTRLPL